MREASSKSTNNNNTFSNNIINNNGNNVTTTTTTTTATTNTNTTTASATSTSDEISTSSSEFGEKSRVVKVNLRELNDLAAKYSALIAEAFFLQNVRGTYSDFEGYLRKAHSALLAFLKTKTLDPEDPNLLLRALYNGRVPQNSPFKPAPVVRDKTKGGVLPQYQQQQQQHQPGGILPSSGISTGISSSSSGTTSYNVNSSSGSTSIITTCSNRLTTAGMPAATTSSSSGTSQLQPQQTHFHKPPDVIQPGRKYSLKAEASVVQRISELQKEGMWYDRRLPKTHEPSRIKAHWDYLLEEMTWLAADFASERKWKRIASKRCARMIDKYFNDREIERARAEKEEEARLRRIASFIAKEIRNFWSNAQQIVEYKEQSRIEEMKKKALDQQLSYIVDQTEKYSSMLAESFVGDTSLNSTLDTTHDSGEGDTADLKPSQAPSDDEFEPAQESEEDDEETIAKEEEEHDEGDNELVDLERSGQMSLDDLLDDLPPEYLEELASKLPKPDDSNAVTQPDSEAVTPAPVPSDEIQSQAVPAEEEIKSSQPDEDESTTVTEDSTSATPKALDEALDSVMEAEPAESASEFESEIDESDSETAEDEESSEAEDSDMVTEEEEEPEDEEQTVGLASLLQTFAPERAGEDHEDDALNSVAAMAESFQPKGYTLSSQKVNTKVPSLLHHELREYQLIGLDWLVTMYEKKLNGILADEMGLGKTIQTIALLAHLACEKGNWGPHLIVVPTSVMLNWEMEFKKWCPGFKILTYYGSIKERRLKRTGWTKPNAFHVCITSYKLVIQDHASFRRKRWKYLILDEAQNIKNFKSQRWQLLLNFSTNRRLLLTGTPLQNNLMELWSLMHFLMPNVFQSHREFREWFSNPVSGMVEGNSEYNENIIRRLHKVLRPFILRRLKSEVEKQLPKKHEHVVMCRLSKRQRFLYEDFMSRTKTKETLATGNLLSVINVLMQLRKVCNHPNLFESRPVISPFQSDGMMYLVPSVVFNLRGETPNKNTTLAVFSMSCADFSFTKSQASRMLELKPPGEETLDSKDSSACDEGTDIDSSLKRKHPCDEDMIEYDYILETSVVDELSDGSIRCAPKRRKFLKWCADVALPAPKTKQPIPFLLMNVDPMPYLEDFDFVETVGARAAKTPSLKIVCQPSDGDEMGPENLVLTGSDSVELSEDVLAVGEQEAINHQGATRVRPGNHLSQGETESFEGRSSDEDEKVDDQDEDEGLGDGEESYEQESQDSESYSEGDDEGPARKRRKKTTYKKDSKRLRRGSPRQDEDDEEETGHENSAEEEFESSDIDETSSEDFNLDRKHKHMGYSRSNSGAQWVEAMGYNPIEFQEADVQARSLRNRRALIERLKFVNDRRCEMFPVIGFDAVDQCKILGQLPIMRYYGTRCRHLKIPYRGRSVKRDYVNNAYFLRGWADVCIGKLVKNSEESRIRNHPLLIWVLTKALMSMIWTLNEVLEDLSAVLKRFIIYVPAVSSSLPSLRVFHPSPSLYAEQFNFEEELREVLREPTAVLHPIISSMSTQFPDPRLIQYDCGKLQVLDMLLRRLKTEGHRVLIFTQMAKMLDVLEAFLNYHGHIYLRLDGATRIDQRQILMEKFNSDKRIFCFILSTRSGGIGVNLTGADTVIFYDSDWNPTMDAQAQDRCHRIGQTRDVHIYRLVSEKTIEENILKKSNQKRLLGELAIEGGNFTTAYFRKSSIYELFDIQTNESDARKRIMDQPEEPEEEEIKEMEVEEEPSLPDMPDVDKNKIQIFESALAAAEDETDVQATRTVKAEAAAELAEFDESIPLEELGDGQEIVEKSMIDTEMESIMAELSRVEIYALRFMERTIDDWSRETVAQAQKELEQQKREWELEQIRQLEARNKLGPEFSDEEEMITYSAADAQNQVWISQEGGEQFMPLWAPPTPPSDDTDVYVDYCHGFLYDYGLIPESALPPVYQPPKKDKKPTGAPLPTAKQATVSAVAPVTPPDEEATTPLSSAVEKKSPKVPRRDEPIFAPRSLFDRPSPALAKLRRDYRLQKYSCRPVGTAALAKTTLGPGAITFPIVHPTATKAPSPPPQHESVEWMIAEDHALLQTIQNILEMPLSLLVVNLAQTPNWDLAAEMVNLTSKIYRTPKQCKIRYETIVGPREEGKLFYEQPPAAKKQKKSKSFIKVGPPSPSRTGRIVKMSQLISADNNSQLLNTYMGKFDVIKNITVKRPVSKPMTLNPHMKTNKQAATIFAEHGINLESPISATAIAQARYERVQMERKKLYAAQQAAAAATMQQQQQAVAAATMNAAALKVEGGRVAAASVGSVSTPSPSASPTVGAANVPSVPQASVAVAGGVATTTNVSATASEVHKAKIAAAAAQAQSSDVPVFRFTHPANASALQELIARRGNVGTTASSPIIAKRQYAVSQQQNQLQQQLQILQQHQSSQKHSKISLQLAPVAHKPAQGSVVQQASGGAVQQITSNSPQQVVINQPASSGVMAKTQASQGLSPSVQIQGQKQVVVSSTGQVVSQQTGQPQVISQPIQLQQKQVVMYQQAIQQKQQQQQIQIQLSQAPSMQTATVHQAGTSAQTVQVSAPSMVISQPPSQLTPASQLAQSLQLQGQKQVMVTGSGQAQLVQQQQQPPQQQIQQPQQTQAQQQQQAQAQPTIQIQGKNQVVMAYSTSSQAQMGQKAQLVQQQAAQQQQQPTQVHVHLHPQPTPSQGVTVGHGTQTVVLPPGLAEALSSVVGSPSGNLTSGQLTNLIATSTPVTVVSSGASTGVVTASTVAATAGGTLARAQTLGQQLGQHAGQQGQRTVTMQLVKQHTVGGKTVTRTVSDAEVAAFLKQHGLTTSSARVAIAGQPGTQAQIGQLTGSKGGQQVTQVQVPTAQIITSVGLQKLGYQISPSGSGAQVATMLKTPTSQTSGAQGTSVAFPVSFSQVKGVPQKAGTIGKQSAQMSAIQQQLLSQQRRQTQQLQQQQQQQQVQQQQQTASKLAHLAQVSSAQGTVPQLIVQATPNQLQKAINVQHIQHVLKPGQVIQGQSGVLQAQLLAQKAGLSRVATSTASGVSNVAVSGVGQQTMVAVSSAGLPTTVTIPTGLMATTAGGQPGIIRISQQNQSIKPGSIQMITAQTASILNQQQQQTLARPYLPAGQTISAVNVSGGQQVSLRLQGTGTGGVTSTSIATSSPSGSLPVVSVSSVATAPPSLVVASDPLTSPAQSSDGTTIILTEENAATVIPQNQMTVQQQQPATPTLGTTQQVISTASELTSPSQETSS